MKPAIHAGLGIVALLAFSTTVSAQGGMTRVSTAPAVRHVVMNRTPVVVHTRPIFRLAQIITSTNSSLASPNVTVLNGGFGLSVQDLLNPVPGFGFDFVHLAAMNRDLGVRALIDPVTQLQLAQAERLLRETPIVPTVFPVFGGFGSEPVAIEPQQPQVIIVQQPVPAAPAGTAPAPDSRTPAASAPEATPVPEVGEFILVQRDGTQLLAVAFTRQGNNIVYITGDGLRRSIPLIDLDPDATTRANDLRGTPVQLPL